LTDATSNAGSAAGAGEELCADSTALAARRIARTRRISLQERAPAAAMRLRGGQLIYSRVNTAGGAMGYSSDEWGE